MKRGLMAILLVTSSLVMAGETRTIQESISYETKRKCYPGVQRVEVRNPELDSEYYVYDTDTKTYDLHPVYLSEEIKTYRIKHWVEVTLEMKEEWVASNGKTSNWNGFFNVKKDKKAKVLSELVKGISLNKANILVQKNTLSYKPSSWNKFITVLSEAEIALSDSEENPLQNLVKDVTSYEVENKKVLGYLKSVKEEQEVSREPKSGLPELIGEAQLGKRTDLKAEVIVNADLLSKERFDITYTYGCHDGEWNISISNSDYLMSEKQNFHHLIFKAKRKKITPKNTLSFDLQVQDGVLHLTNIQDKNTDETIYRSLQETNGSMTIKGQAEFKKWGWWNEEQSVGKFEVKWDGQSSMINTGVKVSGELDDLQVRYQTRYSNSLYFNNKLSSTETIRY